MPQMREAVSSGTRGRPRPRERLSRLKGVTEGSDWMERVARKVPGGEQPTLEGREIYRKRMTSKVKLTF